MWLVCEQVWKNENAALRTKKSGIRCLLIFNKKLGRGDSTRSDQREGTYTHIYVIYRAGQILVGLQDQVETPYAVYETQKWMGPMVVSVWVSSLEILNIHDIGYRLNRITVKALKDREEILMGLRGRPTSSGRQFLIFPPKNIPEPIN